MSPKLCPGPNSPPCTDIAEQPPQKRHVANNRSRSLRNRHRSLGRVSKGDPYTLCQWVPFVVSFLVLSLILNVTPQFGLKTWTDVEADGRSKRRPTIIVIAQLGEIAAQHEQVAIMWEAN